MGGGDLNTKKSWHPKTGKNQERVWKAEQVNNAEKKKVADLQKEIQEERTREELTNIARKSGYIEDDKKGKLEWMYKGSSDMLNREEYLTGRAVDKNFETLSANQIRDSNPAISVPKNHVESDIIPYSIREYSKLENKNAQNSEQVDMQRKLVEDPLMAIKQKEIEMRRKILENPVKLKELHRLLRLEKDQNPSEKEKSKKSSSKKSKKKKKRRDSSSASAASSDDEQNLDKLLVEKIKGIKGNDDDSDDEANLDKVLAMKYNAIAKELDEMAKKKKKKRKGEDSDGSFGEPEKKSKKFDVEMRGRSGSKDQGNQRRRSYSRDARDSRKFEPKRFNNDRKNFHSRTPEKFGNGRNERNFGNFGNRRPDPPMNRNQRDQRRSRDRDFRRSPIRNNRPVIPTKSIRRSRSHEGKSTRRSRSHEGKSTRRSRSHEGKSTKRSKSRDKKLTKRSRSKDEKSSKRSRSRGEKSRNEKKKSPERKRNYSRERSSEKSKKRNPSPPTRRSSSSSSENFTPERVFQDSDDEKRQKKRFGLVTASGKKIALDRKEKVKLYSKDELKAAKEAIKPAWARIERKKMTEEEIDQKRREMVDNSKWREKDRAVAVKRYREEDSEKVDKNYDKDFLNKQMKKAQTTISSVESRIKSNMANIQRSSRVMDTNFARR